MGGDLVAAPANKVPKIMVRAVRDPDGANLDRIQIIKGWADKYGKTHEKIYDVAVSDDRKPNSDGKYPPVGNTVNIDDLSYSNSIGDPTMGAYWTDPDFDPSLRAFYYVRVLEIPTPTWLAYDLKVFGGKMPEGAKSSDLVLQERAYTSPIWYTPGE
jgi:hypothetical protein